MNKLDTAGNSDPTLCDFGATDFACSVFEKKNGQPEKRLAWT
jgi:hypothetical protein